MKNLEKILAVLSAISLTSAVNPAYPLFASAGVSSDGTFETADTNWKTETSDSGTGVLQGTIENGVYSVYIENPGGENNGGEDRWDCMFWQKDLSLTYGHTYRITYSVKTDHAGHFYTKLGDANYDDAEYWHQCGNKLNMTYESGISQEALETNLRNSKLTTKESTDNEQGEWDVPYWEGWQSWQEDEIPENQWVTYAYEFIVDKERVLWNADEVGLPDANGTVRWEFHFGGTGTYTPFDCFPAGTTLQFDNLALIDMSEAEPSTEPTTEAPTEPATEPVKASFLDGRNNWGFGNTYRIFGNEHYINDTHKEALLDGLENTEKQNVLNLLNSEWNGSCYGMAITSILSCYDILKPSDWQTDAVYLYDIKTPSEDVKSLIHYYFALQSTDYIQQNIKQALYLSEEDKLDELVKAVSDGTPTLLTFYGRFGGGTQWGGHAVVAYGAEYGTWKKNGSIYDGRILIYDNQKVDFNEDYCLYFNTVNKNWTIPGHKLESVSKTNPKGATLGLITNSLDVMNHHGYLNGEGSKTDTDYISEMTCNYIEQDFSVQKVTRNKDNTVISAPTSEDEIKFFSSLSEGQAAGIMKIAFADSSKGYEFAVSSPETISTDMNYPNYLLNVKANKATSVIFEPEGCITLNGKNTDYNLSIIANADCMSTDWYRINVAGTGNKVFLEQIKEGYILQGDSLKDIQVAAYLNPNTTNSATELSFSTDYDSVLIYEINKDTIGIKADTDGDGTYDEDILTQLLSKIGDADGSGEIDILDVITLNKAMMGKDALTDTQLKAIDFNGNGKPDSDEALMLLKYIVGLIDTLT